MGTITLKSIGSGRFAGLVIANRLIRRCSRVVDIAEAQSQLLLPQLLQVERLDLTCG
jgi:hypothetical protein